MSIDLTKYPTRRTDEAAFNINPDGGIHYTINGGYVGRDLSESLERENAALREALKDLMTELTRSVGDMESIPEIEDHWEFAKEVLKITEPK